MDCNAVTKLFASYEYKIIYGDIWKNTMFFK